MSEGQQHAAPEMAAEQAADLAALMAQVEEVEGGTDDVQRGAGDGLDEDHKSKVMLELQETGPTVVLIHSVLSPMFKTVRERYGVKEQERIAQAWAVLAVKRPGFSMRAIMGKWGPEFMFAFALGAPVLQDVMEWIVSKKEDKQADPVQAAPTQVSVPDTGSEAPGSRVVQFGTVQP